ncbi:hypothetical protein [Desulfosporosinus nitroreducens]|uniref:hypothetical protein n=1 Tax=Desulfosporosinus nitroreducens TaxID=2018668 RepID=UPI00207D6C30|nr:hypothetical protein [Desulfosporosinus nitroreducens]MCO1601464.1 hypothetical protein [Desulfosporosinus nitroreducens]
MVMVTHQDHVGSLSCILRELPNSVKVLAHKEEKHIQGEKLKAFYENSEPNVNKAISDGEELPFCGGITVIYTPDHTLGHI